MLIVWSGVAWQSSEKKEGIWEAYSRPKERQEQIKGPRQGAYWREGREDWIREVRGARKRWGQSGNRDSDSEFAQS